MRIERRTSRLPPRDLLLSLGALLRQPKVIGLSLGLWLVQLCLLPAADLAANVPFRGTAHRSAALVSSTPALPWLFATATDLFLGGMLVDALVSRGWNAPRVRKVVLVAGTACGLGILGAAHAHSATQALTGSALSIGGLSAAAPVGWSVPALITPRGSVGKVGGIVNFVCQVSGITAQILTGYIVQGNALLRAGLWHFGSLPADWDRWLSVAAGTH